MSSQPLVETLKVVNKSSNKKDALVRKFTFVKRKDFVASVEKRQCKMCNQIFDLTRDFFGNTPSGNFGWQCRACMRNHVKSYAEKNPNTIKAQAELRRVREGNVRPIDDATKNFLLKKYQNKCAYCDLVLNDKFHVDHIQPVVKNGDNSLKNLAVCCAKCNLAKHAKTAEEFYAWMDIRKIKYRLPKLVQEN